MWSGLAILLDELGQSGLGVRAIRSIEDEVDAACDLSFEILSGNVSLSVLLEMELAALPGRGVEGGAKGRFDAFVGVGGNRNQAGRCRVPGGRR